jgi:cation transport ATPase
VPVELGFLSLQSSGREADILIGNRSWLKENSVSTAGEMETVMAQYETRGRTALAVAINGVPAGVCRFPLLLFCPPWFF